MFWRIKLWWKSLWIRRDEFHSSFDLDLDAMMRMTPEKLTTYHAKVVRRRQIAHERTLI